MADELLRTVRRLLADAGIKDYCIRIAGNSHRNLLIAGRKVMAFSCTASDVNAHHQLRRELQQILSIQFGFAPVKNKPSRKPSKKTLVRATRQLPKFAAKVECARPSLTWQERLAEISSQLNYAAPGAC
jgi:hypothetical protein